MIHRRGLIAGLVSLVAAPAIVRSGLLMPVRSWKSGKFYFEVPDGFTPWEEKEPGFWFSTQGYNNGAWEPGAVIRMAVDMDRAAPSYIVHYPDGKPL